MVEPQQRFVIDGLTPDTLPMERLAEYLADLAKLIGHREEVHFRAVEKGSAVLAWEVAVTVREPVGARLHAVEAGAGPDEAMRAYRAINLKLATDRATARLDDAGAVLLHFPGQSARLEAAYGPFAQRGSLEGVLVRVGGRDATAHVILEDRDVVWARCETSRELASGLAQWLYRGRIRVHGPGRWRRTEEGVWHLDRFKIESFEVLDDASIRDTVDRLRSVPGNEWSMLPWSAIQDLRRGDDAS